MDDYDMAVRRRMSALFREDLVKKRAEGVDCLTLSIMKWTFVVNGGDLSLYGDDCPCCWEHADARTSCRACPIYKFTGKAECRGSPWRVMADVVSKEGIMGLRCGGRLLTKEEREKLQPYFEAELAWLKALKDGDTKKCEKIMTDIGEPPKVKKKKKIVYHNFSGYFTVTSTVDFAVTFNSEDDGDPDDWDEEMMLERAMADVGISEYEDFSYELEVEEEEIEEDE